MAPISRKLARAGRVSGELLLTTAAIGGAVCIILAALAFFGGFSLMLFKTGSMSPTIPAGSVALVQKISADELHVGDIITVDRPGALPITHRITRIDPGSSPQERIITLRGDANATDDPIPYPLTEARIVRGSVPHLAPVIAQFGNPWVLGALTLGAAALVSWAFWPRRAREPLPQPDDPRAPEPDASDADDPDADVPDAPEASASRAGRSGQATRVLSAAIIACAAAGAATIWPAGSAAAASAPSVLTVRSDLAGAGVQRLDDVDPLLWHVDIDAGAAPRDGDLTVAYSASGDPLLGLRAEVRSCALPWTPAGVCTADERLLRPAGPVATDAQWRTLWTARTPSAVYLRIALTATPTLTDGGDLRASVTVRASAAGETVDTDLDGGQELPPTGGTSHAFLAAPAAVLIGLGIALAARRRPRAHRGSIR